MMPTTAETEAIAESRMPVRQRIPRPSGCVNMNGTRKHGSAYFQVSIIVLYGLPPVIAAAANGESATGGETSLRGAEEKTKKWAAGGGPPGGDKGGGAGGAAAEEGAGDGRGNAT